MPYPRRAYPILIHAGIEGWQGVMRRADVCMRRADVSIHRCGEGMFGCSQTCLGGAKHLGIEARAHVWRWPGRMFRHACPEAMFPHVCIHTRRDIVDARHRLALSASLMTACLSASLHTHGRMFAYILWHVSIHTFHLLFSPSITTTNFGGLQMPDSGGRGGCSVSVDAQQGPSSHQQEPCRPKVV